MKDKVKPCLVACSVLKDEIDLLVQRGDLDVEIVYVSKYFHVDYPILEKNLRLVLEKTIQRFPKNVILVYGDYCLGMQNEMKKITKEYGLVKVDAVNCIDCQMGGKGKYLEADPDQDLMFLSVGMTDFFQHMKGLMKKENMGEESLQMLFKGLKGIILLDTLGDSKTLEREVQKLDTGLLVLETRYVGVENVKNVILEAIERNNEKA